tara:strand:- start:1296 stop:1715 length:420 start_codon:yes stop_codon:yes gene_type:complete
MKPIIVSKDFSSVYSLIKKIKAGTYKMDISYKRDDRTFYNYSSIIESAIYGLELPAVHLKYNRETIDCIKNSKLVMVFAAYIDNKFHIRGGEFDGKKFEDLIPLHRNRIEDYTIYIRLLPSADAEQTEYYLNQLEHFDR